MSAEGWGGEAKGQGLTAKRDFMTGSGKFDLFDHLDRDLIAFLWLLEGMAVPGPLGARSVICAKVFLVNPGSLGLEVAEDSLGGFG